MKSTWIPATMACALAALTLACGGEKPAPAPAATTAPAATMAPAATVAAAPAATAPAAAPAAGSVGIPECDAYITKYEACLSQHVPEGQKVQFQQGLDAMRTSWKAGAANSESRPALAKACQQATDAAKAATGFYGCTW